MLDYSIYLLIYSLFLFNITSTKPCVSSVINVLNRSYETEIQTTSYYQTPAIRERIRKILRKYWYKGSNPKYILF